MKQIWDIGFLNSRSYHNTSLKIYEFLSNNNNNNSGNLMNSLGAIIVSQCKLFISCSVKQT